MSEYYAAPVAPTLVRALSAVSAGFEVRDQRLPGVRTSGGDASLFDPAAARKLQRTTPMAEMTDAALLFESQLVAGRPERWRAPGDFHKDDRHQHCRPEISVGITMPPPRVWRARRHFARRFTHLRS